MRAHVLYLIDDRPNEAEEYQEFLAAAAEGIEIRLLPPPTNKEDVGALMGIEETAGFIIDHRLDEAAAYDGTDLAVYLRTIRKEIPVFMLTSYSHDVEVHEHSDVVDIVYSKDLVRTKAASFARRMERRIGQYDEAISGKMRRLTTLIDKVFADEISEDEKHELEGLQRDFERPVDARLSAKVEEDESAIGREEMLVTRLERLVATLKKGGGDS